MKIDKYIKILENLVKIPSISSLDSYKEDVVKSANFVASLFEDLGLVTKIINVENGQPAVLAKTEVDPKKRQFFFMHTMMFNQLETKKPGIQNHSTQK